jgi:hypothetical protein
LVITSTKANFGGTFITLTYFGVQLPQYRHFLDILVQSCPEEFMTNLAGVVQQLRKERDQAANTVNRLDAALAALNGRSGGKRTGTRSRLSAAARARIAAAQRARWAKQRGNGGQAVQKPKVVSMPTKKKTMSPAARRKIAAAVKARWAKIKAAQKKSA